MDYETIEFIRQKALRHPEAYRYTLACLTRRDGILESIDEMGVQHDSLEAESHIRYAIELESCDAMLEKVFEMELGRFEQEELPAAI